MVVYGVWWRKTVPVVAGDATHDSVDGVDHVGCKCKR